MNDDMADDTTTGTPDGTLSGTENADRPVARVYYAEGQPAEVAVAVVVEDWPWVLGFDQTGTADRDYVAIPVDRVVGIRATETATAVVDGQRVVVYGVDEDGLAPYLDRLPV